MAPSVGGKADLVCTESSNFASARNYWPYPLAGSSLHAAGRLPFMLQYSFIASAEQFLLGRICGRELSLTSLRIPVPAMRRRRIVARATILPAECRRVLLNRASHLLETLSTDMATAHLADPAFVGGIADFIRTAPSDNASPRKWLDVSSDGSAPLNHRKERSARARARTKTFCMEMGQATLSRRCRHLGQSCT